MIRTYSKPSVREVHDFLARSQALIVHFSGTPPGLGKPREFRFPDDLKQVVTGRAMGGLSCSLVKPGDTFHGDVRHALGTVGVIVDLRAPESLRAVGPRDVGSYEDDEGVRHAYDQDITVADLERSLADRGARYNEWVVRDYIVRGLFIAPPLSIWGHVYLDIPQDAVPLFNGEPTLGSVNIDVLQVLAHYPDFAGFTFEQDLIVNVRNGSSVTHVEIYRQAGLEEPVNP